MSHAQRKLIGLQRRRHILLAGEVVLPLMELLAALCLDRAGVIGKFTMKTARILAAAALASASSLAFTSSAMAQAADQVGKPASGEEESAPSDIIVTGSRIARPNLESTVPITSVGGEEIFQSGNTSVGDLLNDLPALRSTYSQANSSRFLGTTGLNLLDLRGLGTQRTLVLVNGRRHVGSDILNNAVSPDTNTFPSDLIERIDIVTGGNSAVYGSDAIAGVVNFVLKKNFDGVQVRGQGGVSKYGDAGNYFASALAGTNFADGRGNIAVNLEYAHQSPFFASARPNLAANSGFVVVDTDPSGSDGVIDRVFVRNIRSTTIANGGLLQFSPRVGSGLAPCGRDSAGTAFRCTYIFQPDGTLAPQTGTRVGLAPNGSFDGGNGTTGREAKLLGVFPTLDRYSANLIGHFTISDAFEPFIEAKYVKTDSLRFGSPAFFQGSTIGGGVDLRERPRFDNPFLSATARTQINAARVLDGLAPITVGSTRLSLFKNFLDLGGRQEAATRETFRIVGGINGTFNDDWKYELALNYGSFKEKTKVIGNLNTQRFLLAMDATTDPTGKIVCRSQIDPTAALINQSDDGNAFGTARLAADVAACVPLNPFGQGNVTDAMRQYLLQDTTSVGSIKQFVASANLSGDTSNWFELPGGPIGFAVGAEYRRETNFFQADDLVASGITFYNALPLFNPPAFSVKEAYGEVRVPILKDVPFFHELTLSGAGRVSKYRGGTGTVYAYNGGIDWAPIKDVRFRGGWARSVRAPNLVDLYSEQSQNFATVVDPCSARNIGTGAATRVANCAAQGIPAAYDYVYVASLEILSGGNPSLRAETSDSLTVGAVVQPSFVPGLSLTADYYDITVNKVITSPSAQQILNACYDATDLNNQFCTLFRRAGAAGAASGEVAYQIIEGSLQQTSLNYAKSKVRGLDIEASYKRELDNIGTLSTRVVYTHMFQIDDFLDPANPGKADQTLLELGDPKDALNWDTEFKRGNVTLGFGFRYIGKQVLNTYEDFFSKQGRPPENEDYAAVKFYPSTFYQDVRVGLDVNKSFNIYAGVDNVFDRQPPFGLSGTGGGSGIYDTRGRFMYAGVKAKF
jgi:outer membrane receptor protein involved in Fe transport